MQHFKDKSILVTGATGLTGQLLCRKLASSGARVRAIARDSSNISVLDDIEVEWVRGLVYDRDTLAIATKDVHYVFHVAAALNEEMNGDEDFRKVHVYSTQILAEMVVDQPQFERFLHVSTVGVHGHIEVERADENYRFSPGDAYQRTKLEAEQWLVEFSKETGLPYAVVRPTPIYGPGDKRLLKFFRMAKKGFVLMLGKGEGMYHLVHVDDLTNIILLAAAKKEALGEIFIGAADEPISIIDMGKTIGRHIGTKPRIVRLPLWPFYLAADFSSAIFPRLGMQPPIYRRRVDFYTKDRRFNNQKVHNLLGYAPKIDNDSGLAETAAWYQQQDLI